MIRYEDIAEKVKVHHPKADMSLLQKAYVFSAKAHSGQVRKSGEPYLAHPLEVANILADMGLDVAAVTVGMLHDIVEDTLTDSEEVRKLFGETVALIVDGVTKISRIPFTSIEQKQAENFRKLLLAMSHDIRVILVKLADRLHNMRTLRYLSPEQKERIARETMEIYVPIANRLGMGKIKGELEDIAFSYLDPERYQEIIAMIEKRRAQGEKVLRDAEAKLRKTLETNGIRAEFQARIKRVHSVHAKLKRQGIHFDEVYDFLALRTITDSVPNCYAILGYLHSLWRLVPGRFKDFIGMPRPNGYQSVHTTVMTESGIPLEIQIRTKEMHRMAEEGIAAHWMYKEGRLAHDDTDQRFAWLRHLMEWQKEVDDPHEFLANLKVDLFPEEVHCFTPKGDLITLPKGATPLDFAYEIHTDIGNRCSQAKVNGRAVPLKYTLRNGEIVEIATARDRFPSREWISFVKTTKAKNKIRQWLKKHELQDAMNLGESLLEKEAARLHTSLKAVKAHIGLSERLASIGVSKWDDLVSGVGFGRFSAASFLAALLQTPPEQATAEGQGRGIAGFMRDMFRRRGGCFQIRGMDGAIVARADCCNPLPGEPVVGYMSPGQGVVVHAKNCSELEHSPSGPSQKVDVSWGRNAVDEHYFISLVIHTDDRKGMVADISNRISRLKANIRDFQAKSTEAQGGVFQVTVEVNDVHHLAKILKMIKGIKNVRGVERVDRSPSPATAVN